MKLIEAKEKIAKLAYIPFKDYLSEIQYKNIIVNKGKTGQLLEATIGLSLSNTTLDFEDGELKTNKCNRFGHPMETMFITQTASIIDELLTCKPFHETKLYKKIRHLLYVPISKDGDPHEWMYLKPIEVDLSSTKYKDLALQLETDYNDICDLLNDQLCRSNTATLHTASGKYIQIRTKDSKPYTPIYSNEYNRIISDKNRAFYFQKAFMNHITSLEK
ncbi:MAG: DNA mismatch repair protein MutH [Lachnospiraceae bacterium]|nr:DNA mismatch repair protein MutH [Lachnospiraceae bacterium]